ncbi:hypothetical protein J6590_104782 [Homalodisca vitripennis]|nr:hypothetical protein J6590_104782 [Homalodisca vitripennis]
MRYRKVSGFDCVPVGVLKCDDLRRDTMAAQPSHDTSAGLDGGHGLTLVTKMNEIVLFARRLIYNAFHPEDYRDKYRGLRND